MSIKREIMHKELKFKVGDKVRIIKPKNMFFKVGDEEEIKGIYIKYIELIRKDETIHNCNVYYLLRYRHKMYGNMFRESYIEKIEDNQL